MARLSDRRLASNRSESRGPTGKGKIKSLLIFNAKLIHTLILTVTLNILTRAEGQNIAIVLSKLQGIKLKINQIISDNLRRNGKRN